MSDNQNIAFDPNAPYQAVPPVSSQDTGAPAFDPTAPYQTASAAPPPNIATRVRSAIDTDPNIQAILGAAEGATEHTQGLGPVKTLIGTAREALPISGFLQDLSDVPSEYRAYEAARAQGKSVVDAANIAAEAYKQRHDAIAQFKDVAKEFVANPGRATGKAIADLLPFIIGGGALPEIGAAPETEAANASKISHVMTRDASGKLTLSPVESAASPIEAATSKIAGKSGIAEGAAAPTSEAVQAPIQTGIRSVASDIAKNSGVSPKAATTIRDVLENTGDAVRGKSTAAYQALDDASGGRWQRFDDAIKNLNDKMDEVVGVDDEKYDQYAAKRADIEANQKAMIDQLVKDRKVNPALAEQAKADYAQAQALYDTSQQVRAATTGRAGIGSGETINPKTLSAKLNKLYDSGRLQQATGSDDVATQLLQHADTAQTLSELPSTGQKALQELLSRNTKEGRVYGTNTDFGAALDEFNRMKPEVKTIQFPGKSAAEVRNLLKSRALRQLIKKVTVRSAAGVGGAVGSYAVGKELYDTLHKLF
jgi:hypothetical protein